MIGHFQVSRDRAMAMVLAGFIRDYPEQYALMDDIEMAPVFDSDADFDGFLITALIHEKETVSSCSSGYAI